MELNVDALVAFRERSGLTTSGLAREAGISQPTLWYIEAGQRKASDPTIRRLAVALKVPVTVIIHAPQVVAS